MGQPLIGSFSFETRLQRGALLRSAGLFFGLLTNRQEYGWLHEYQSIEMDWDANAESTEPRILWSQSRVEQRGDDFQTHRDPLADCRVPSGSDRTGIPLRVTLGTNGFPRVSWADEELPPARWTLSFEARQRANASGDRAKLVHLGRLGLVATAGETSFCASRLRYNAETSI